MRAILRYHLILRKGAERKKQCQINVFFERISPPPAPASFDTEKIFVQKKLFLAFTPLNTKP